MAILAGGQSRRMGRNKALLPVQGRPLVAWIAERVRDVADEIIIVTRTPETYAFLGYPLAQDVYDGVGPLAGLHAALQAAHRDWVLALACDMPLVHVRVITYMLGLTADTDVVMPVIGGREEPLHALYRRDACLPAVERAITQGKRRLISFLPDVRVRYVREEELRTVDPDLQSFANANTPAEWDALMARLTHGSGRNLT